MSAKVREGSPLPWIGWEHQHAEMLDAPPATVDPQVYQSMWNAHYEKMKPGEAWDSGIGSAPALIDLLSSGKCDVKDKSVLIPGCGRGYDNATFIRAGAKEAVGLEVAPAAKAAAEEYLKANLSADEAARAPIQLGDFFSYDPGFCFDVGYDYTFFCAMQPQARQQLASSWARLIKPTGQLIAIIFPVNSKQPDLGPPFPVTPELYKEMFTPAGFILKKLDPVPPSKSHPGRSGMEWMAIFERQYLVTPRAL